MKHAQPDLSNVRGVARLFKVDDKNELQLVAQASNQLQYDWGLAAAMLFGKGDLNYRPSAIILEFENVEDEEDEVSPPAYGRDEGIEYYDGLSGSTTRDYLILPLQSQVWQGIAEGYESYFAGTAGNMLRFAGTTTSSEGVHGLEFSSDVKSKIIGSALIATPVPNDPSKNLVLARMYYEGAAQQIKDAARQFVPTWEWSFK